MKWIFLAIFLALLSSLAFAASDTNNGTSFTNRGSGVNWTSLTNVQLDDNAFAQSILSDTAGTTSALLDANGFGFSVPSTATINGVLVEVKKKRAAAITSGASITDLEASLLNVTGSSDKSDATEYTATLAFYSYGSSSDLWGTTITPAQVNATGFGFSLRAQLNQGTAGTPYSGRAQVDHIRITVYYTLPVAPDVNVVSPGSGSYVRGTVPIDFNMFDPDTNAFDMNLDINYNTIAAAGGTVIVNDRNMAGISCDSNNFSTRTVCHYNWDTTSATDGNYYLVIAVADQNQGTDTNISSAFNVDNTAPTVTISAPSNGSSQTSTTVDLNYSATDSNSGVRKYYVRADGGSWVDTNTETTYSFAGQSVGSHTYTVIANDRADNNGTASVSITISAPASTGGSTACAFSGGWVCQAGDVCLGKFWRSASDTNYCCNSQCTSGTAKPPVEPEPTPPEIPTPTIQYSISRAFYSNPSYAQSMAQSTGLLSDGNYQSADVNVTRTITLFAYPDRMVSNVRLTASNRSGKDYRDLLLVEPIPESLAKERKSIITINPFRAVQSNPFTIAFDLSSLPNHSTASVDYNIERELNNINEFQSPALLYHQPYVIPTPPKPRETILLNSLRELEVTKSEIESAARKANLSAAETQQAVSLIDRVSVRRGIVVRQTESQGIVSHETVIELFVRNQSDQSIERAIVIENIPKAIASNASQIKSADEFQVIEPDPVIKFTAESIQPGQTRKWSYALSQQLPVEALDEFATPLILGAPKPAEQPTAQWVGAGIALILAALGIAYWRWRATAGKN